MPSSLPSPRPEFKFGYVKTPSHGKVFVALHGENFSQAHILKNEKGHFCMKNIQINDHEDLVKKVNSSFSRSYKNEIPVPDENSSFLFVPIKGHAVKRGKIELNDEVRDRGFVAMTDAEERGVPMDFLTEKGLFAIIDTNYPLYLAMRSYLLNNYQFNYEMYPILGVGTAEPYISVCGANDSDCFIYLHEIKHILVGRYFRNEGAVKSPVLGDWGYFKETEGMIEEVLYTIKYRCINLISVELTPYILDYMEHRKKLHLLHGNKINTLICDINESLNINLDLRGVEVPTVCVQRHKNSVTVAGNRHIKKLILVDCNSTFIDNLADTVLTHIDLSDFAGYHKYNRDIVKRKLPKDLETFILEGNFSYEDVQLPMYLETLKFYPGVKVINGLVIHEKMKNLMASGKDVLKMSLNNSKLEKLMLWDNINEKNHGEKMFERFGLTFVERWEVGDMKYHLYERLSRGSWKY